MKEVYRLLRNNKESGPFLLEDLVSQDIQPFDLVWVEGKSANWSHPAEIDSLQSFLGSVNNSDTEDYSNIVETEEFVQAEEINITAPNHVNEEFVQAEEITIPVSQYENEEFVQAKENNITTSQYVNKEFVQAEENNITASHQVNEEFVHVSYPTNRFQEIGAEEIRTEELNPSQKLDLRAEELYKRTQAYAATQAQPVIDNEIETPRYTRSLDELKEEYSNRRYSTKREKKKVKPLLAAALLIILIGMFSLMLFNTNKNVAGNKITETNPVLIGENTNDQENLTNKPSPEQEIAPASNFAESQNEIQYGVDEISEADQENINNSTITPSNKNVASKNAAAGNVVTKKDITIQNVEQRNVPTMKKPVVKNPTTISKTSEDYNKSTRNEKPVVQDPNTSISSNSVQRKNAMPLSQVFSLYGVHPAKSKDGVSSFKITIKNNSDQLRFAAVDIFYKKSNGEVIKKETLYFKEIPPHQSMTLVAPSNNLADDVTYRLGLVSSDNGSIYYAQQ